MVFVAGLVVLLVLFQVNPGAAMTMCYNSAGGEVMTTNCTNGCCFNNEMFVSTPNISDICKPEYGGCPITNSTDSECSYYITTTNTTFSYDCMEEKCCYDRPIFDSQPGTVDLCSTNGVCLHENNDDLKKIGYSDECILKKNNDDDFKKYACSASERCCHRNYSAWDDTIETESYCQTTCNASQLTISDTCIYKLYRDTFFTEINCYNGEKCCETNYSRYMLPHERLLCSKVGSGDCAWKGDDYFDYYHDDVPYIDGDTLEWWVILLVIMGIIFIIILLLILCYTYSLKRQSIVTPEINIIKDVEAVEDVDDDNETLRLARVEGLLDDAISSQSIADLKIAISAVESNGFEKALKKKYKLAKQLLQNELDRKAKQTEVERLLDNAINHKDPDSLRNAISEVENHGFQMELNKKYNEAKRLLAEADDRHTRLARAESMLDGGISSRDPADLQAAILETEKNQFENDLKEKYNLAKKALEIYYTNLDEEQKRKNLEEAERIAKAEKEKLEEAERELERLEREKADALRIAEAQRIRDEAKARWKKLWPRFMMLQSLKTLHAKTVLSVEERAKVEAELAEKEKIRQENISIVREQLKAAINEKSIDKLRQSIKATEDNNFETELEELYTEAKKLLERLERIQRVKKAVMELDRPLIAELKSFSDPPPAVYKSLVATYLLLGEEYEDLENWNEIVVMLGKTGKKSVKRRVQELEIEQIKFDAAKDAKKHIHDLDSDTVYEANQAAAVFYEWADLLCDEAFLTV